jgi:chemotaxis protein CheZ
MDKAFTNPALADNVTLDELAQSLETLRVFVARRFDEVSMEINATSQILGMTEDNLTGRFGEVLTVLNGISAFSGDGSPHNVGVELETVLKASEEAANTILDSVDTINALTNADIDWSDPMARADLLGKISAQTSAIAMACSFQDITGQRIGRTIENIRQAEEELTDIAKKIGLKVDERPAVAASSGMASQGDIDALFD